MIAASVWHSKFRSRFLNLQILFAAIFLGTGPYAPAQNWLQPVPAFPLASPASVGGLVIHQRSSSLQPFTVAGQCGAFVGQGDGSFEAWNWPVKLLSHMRITARVRDYTVPIDVNDQSAQITVQPDHTTITFSHAAFTVHEILFAAPCKHQGDPGVIAMFQISAIKPVELTFSFTPEVKRMWPAPNYGAPSPEWVPITTDSGYYLLHTDSDDLAGAVAMPGTSPGILAPYQERPKNFPLQMVLNYDPARDGNRYFPLLMAQGSTAQTASKASLTAQLRGQAEHLRELYEGTAAYYAHFFDTRVVAETPDPRLDQSLRWAEISIDQLRVRHSSEPYGDETALVAGLYSSGDSNRPGFGWFFGRDSLYTLYAVDSYGDFALTRQELDFLLKRQRPDGKIMHEYSQTAELVDWPRLPYEYAAADATPLLLMLLRDYARQSGDIAYLQAHWLQIAKAWDFERTHDSDGDGIYDNSQGTGWVESWPPGMPHQEVYLAALDVQASRAYAQLAALAGKPDDGAAARAQAVAATLEREYKPAGPDGMYAFSYNGLQSGSQSEPAKLDTAKLDTAKLDTAKLDTSKLDTSKLDTSKLDTSKLDTSKLDTAKLDTSKLDTTATIYPAVAWWDGGYALPASSAMFRRWASHEFSTDWGTRDLGEHEALYDPISYHQGSVWPLFTGWASLAEYRTGRPLSGYAHLMQNADMTWSQDLGAVTELLSGQYFEPLGRSTTHQLWSSAMVLSPALRGLFGVSFDFPTNTLTVAPQLPATWSAATLRHVPVGDGKRVTLVFTREGAALQVRAQPEGGIAPPRLASPAGTVQKDTVQRGTVQGDGSLRIPLPGAEIELPAELPLPGSPTAQLKVLSQGADAHSATWVLEAKGGSTCALPLRLNGIEIHALRAEGATIQAQAPTPGHAPLAGDALVAPAPAASKALAPPGSLQTLTVHFLPATNPATDPATNYVQQSVTVRW